MLWLIEHGEHGELDERELVSALEHESGLLGLTGTADMREILTRATAGDERAILGRDVYIHRLRAAISAMAASLGGLGALDAGANARSELDTDVSANGAAVRTHVIAAREDREIARQVRAPLSQEPSGAPPGRSVPRS